MVDTRGTLAGGWHILYWLCFTLKSLYLLIAGVPVMLNVSGGTYHVSARVSYAFLMTTHDHRAGALYLSILTRSGVKHLYIL